MATSKQAILDVALMNVRTGERPIPGSEQRERTAVLLAEQAALKASTELRAWRRMMCMASPIARKRLMELESET